MIFSIPERDFMIFASPLANHYLPSTEADKK